MCLLKTARLAAIALLGFLYVPANASAQPPTQPAQEGAPALLLESLIPEVLKVNPQIEAARLQWEVAKQEIPQARSLEDPQLSITQWDIPSDFAVGGADQTWYGVGQGFPFPGKRSLRGQISAKAADAAEQEFRAMVREGVAAVKSAYYQLFGVHKAVDLHLEHQGLLEEFIQIAQQKYALGQVSQQDSLKAQVELSKLHNSLLVLEQEKTRLKAQINKLLNRPPESPLGRPEEVSYRPFPVTLEELKQQALDERPEIKAAAFMIEKNEKAKTLARKNYLPDFMAELSYWDVHTGPNRWMMVGKINLPWVFKAKYDARIRQAEAEEAKARADYQAVHNQTLFELKDLFSKVKTTEQLILVYQNGVLPQAEQALEAARIGYQAGRVDFLNLIDSERTLRDFQLEYYTALAQFEKYIAELERSAGAELRF